MLEKVNAARVHEISEKAGKLTRFPLGKGGLKVWKVECIWPESFTRSAERFEDLEDLIDLGVTSEQGPARGHLCKDAASRPHVDTGGVLFSAE